jgi:hypothetical protein
MNESTQKPTGSDEWETDFRRWGKRPQPELRPFFYTRLQARLAESVESAIWLPWWLRRPAYAYSALLLLVMLNVGAAWWATSAQPVPDQSATITASTPILDDYEVDPVILAYE